MIAERSLQGKCDGTSAGALRTAELVGSFERCAEWPAEGAPGVLWMLATSRQVEVEWLAAKALALAPTTPHATLTRTFDHVVEQAAPDG